MPKVFATASLPGRRFSTLSSQCELVVWGGPLPIPSDALLRGVAGADGLLCLLTDSVDAAVLDAAGPGLRCVATCSVGVDHVDVAACAARGVSVCHTPGVLTQATADLTWALILAATRRVVEGDRLVRQGRFDGWRHDMLLGLDLHGATLGVVGLGRIGTAVASRAVGFGMHVLFHDPSATDAPDTWEPAPLAELLARADVVSLHVPLNDKTHHLLDAVGLAGMKRGAYLINTSRGPVVDEAALVQALRSGHLAGAGLDVYEREPRLAQGLAELSQVVLLPHLGSAARGTRARMADMVVADLLAVLGGARPKYALC